MIISKRRLRRLVREACGLDPQQPAEAAPLAAPPGPEAEVPVPEDYQATRNFLDQNPDLFDMAIGSVMSAVGAGCERSTAQAIVDHMKDMLGSGQQQPEAMPLELPMMMPENAEKALRRRLRKMMKESMELTADSPGVLSVRLLSRGPAYFIAGSQVDSKTHAMLDNWDDDIGAVNVDAYEAAVRKLGITHVLDQNFQEMGQPELYRPLPVDEYFTHADRLFS